MEDEHYVIAVCTALIFSTVGSTAALAAIGTVTSGVSRVFGA